MTGTITVTGGTGGNQPNLVPFQPDGWSDKIVVSTNPGDGIDDKPLFDDQPLYLDWAIANISPETAVTDSFVTRILIDGVEQFAWPNDALGADRFVSSNDNMIGIFTAGTHTIRMEVDAANAVSESAEDDNVYVKSIVVTARDGGNPRRVQITDSSGVPGGTVLVPVTLDSQGDENAVSFSVDFDPAFLRFNQASKGTDSAAASLNTNDSQAQDGRVGIALALPSGQTFSTGIQELVRLEFMIIAQSAGETPLGFSDTPILREIASVQAAALPGEYVEGRVQATTGFEADVTPRPDGNGSVTVTDWVLVGRFAAQLDTAMPGAEFLKADCAPRDTLGNGVLSLTDWVQAGRYAAALDPLTPAGGPSSGSPQSVSREHGSSTNVRVLTTGSSTAERTITARSIVTVAGDVFELVVFMTGMGNENAVGFSLHFDSSVLEFQNAESASGTSVNVNSQSGSPSRLGIVLALDAGESFGAGYNELIRLRFLATDPSPSLGLSFESDPVALELADVAANALPAAFRNLQVTVLDPSNFVLVTDPLFDESGRLTFNIRSESNSTVEVQASGNLKDWTPVGQIANPSGTTSFTEEQKGDGVTFYRVRKIQ